MHVWGWRCSPERAHQFGPGAAAAELEAQAIIGADPQRLARDFVAQHESGRGRGSAAHRVLARTADVGQNHFQDNPMGLFAFRIIQLREIKASQSTLAVRK